MTATQQAHQAAAPAAPVVHAINCEISEMLGPDCTCGAQPAAQSIPFEAIGSLLEQAMSQAVANGADSRSMPDEYVAVAHFLNYADQYRQPAAREPEGQWVPKEPTEAMYDAFASVNCTRSTDDECITFSGDFGNFFACYQAMLRASEPTEGESK